MKLKSYLSLKRIIKEIKKLRKSKRLILIKQIDVLHV